jgi:hypothetical protein
MDGDPFRGFVPKILSEKCFEVGMQFTEKVIKLQNKT